MCIKLLFCAVVVPAVLGFGADFNNMQKVVDGALGENSYFGWDVALSGNYAIVAAANESNDRGSSIGAVYAYENRDGQWINTQKLTAPDAAEYDFFGHAVAMDSNFAVISAVGSFANGPFSGCAYVYRRVDGQWVYQQKITPQNREPGARFGQAVDINGDIILIGAHQAKGAAHKSGAAYIFRYEKEKWIQEAKLVAEDGHSDDFFGYSVALNDRGAALVGAYSAGGKEDKSGAAYLFEMQDGVWKQTAKLTADDGKSRDLFGHSVDLTDDYALIGAYMHKVENQYCGAAYLFHFDGSEWRQRHILLHSRPDEQDHFGFEVCLSDDFAAVAAPRDENDEDRDEGAVYLFEYNQESWREIAISAPDDGAAHDYFGMAVALSGETALIGARLGDGQAMDEGAAYFVGSASPANVKETPMIPKVFTLHQNYPNPFNPTTTIQFDLPAPAFVALTIYDVLGNQVRSLINKNYPAGYHTIVWDGKNESGRLVSSGLYMYKIKADDRVVSKKMMFLK